MARKLKGPASWYGGPHDSQDNNRPALGTPAGQGGIAVYSQKTLGGYWKVRLPNGKHVVLRQTDIGPAPWTGKKIDVSAYTLPKIGYSEGNFPTGTKTFEAEYLGKSKARARRVAADLHAEGAGKMPKAPLKAPKTPRTPPQAQTVTTPGTDNSASRTALLLQYFQNKHKPGALNDLVSGMGGAQDVAPTKTTLPTAPLPAPAVKARKPLAKKASAGAAFPAGPVNGWATADRPGQATASFVKSFVSHVAGNIKQPITINTGSRHDPMTASGNVSDHWVGHAADLNVGGRDTALGDLIAGRALMLAGVPHAQARHMAQTGGLWNITPSKGPYKGFRIQIIWRTDGPGVGDHHDHVHVGLKPL